MAFQQICGTEDMAIGAKKTFQIDGETILLFRLEAGFFATQHRCPHMFASLKKGKIVDGSTIRCRLHRAQFDIRTGKVVRWANFPPGIQALNVLRGEKPLKTYPIKIENGTVFVDVG